MYGQSRTMKNSGLDCSKATIHHATYCNEQAHCHMKILKGVVIWCHGGGGDDPNEGLMEGMH